MYFKDKFNNSLRRRIMLSIFKILYFFYALREIPNQNQI
jgi:hypothetical protein